MSVTTSTNTVSQSVRRVLTDYELHHSESTVSQPAPAPNSRDEPTSDNPEWWPTNYRGIPNRRPINRNLDRELRPNGLHFMETMFIFTMLGGVTINSHAATIWRNTGGRINDRIFRYPIGGEK